MNRYVFLVPAVGMESLVNYECYSESILSRTVQKYYSKLSSVLYSCQNRWKSENLFVQFSNELIAFTNSCIVCDYYSSKGIYPHFVCGYSMGIYGSCYIAGCMSYDQGIELIKHINFSAKETLKDEYCVKTVTGMRYSKLLALIESLGLNNRVQIINVVGRLTLVIAGRKSDVDLLESSLISLRILNVHDNRMLFPYHHSEIMKPLADDLKFFLNDMNMNEPQYSIMSCISQNMLTSTNEIKLELYNNICHAMSWSDTIKAIVKTDDCLLCSMGFGNKLVRISETYGSKAMSKFYFNFHDAAIL